MSKKEEWKFFVVEFDEPLKMHFGSPEWTDNSVLQQKMK